MGKVVRILGIRGVPASHGGFETFAENLSLYLVENGWKVIVYCQKEGEGELYKDHWKGIERVNIPVKNSGAAGTILFDWISTLHAAKSKELVLTLGYNTAIFCTVLRAKKVPNIINMDGIEWKRQKWGVVAKIWFYLNERAGCWLGNHLIADHPEIKKHLASRVSENKITMIPYGADFLEGVNDKLLDQYSLIKHGYMTVIARAEPENSILEIVEGFSVKKRHCKLVVLGKYESDSNEYHKKIMEVASEEVIFLGAIYDKKILNALRFFSLAYVHGHQVGGTNPSLVEAMGAGNLIVAHDNVFNRWVLGGGGLFFKGGGDFSEMVSKIIDDQGLGLLAREKVIDRYKSNFSWGRILRKYEGLLLRLLPK